MNDFNRLTRKPLNQKELEPVDDPDPIKAAVSENTSSESVSGQGISWPLTEEDPSTRTVHDPWYEIKATAGTIVFEYQNYKQFDMTDANGKGGPLIFGDGDA